MPHSRTLPTPSNPTAEGTTYYGAATITAPASLIWSTVLDIQHYSWNTFSPLITTDPPSSSLEPSTRLIIYTYIPPLSPTKPATQKKEKPHQTSLVVTTVDNTNYRLAWKPTGYPTWFFRSERVMEVEDFGDGKCEFRTFETFVGWGRHLVGMMVGGKLDECFRIMADDLGREVGRRMGGYGGGLTEEEGEGEGEGEGSE